MYMCQNRSVDMSQHLIDCDAAPRPSIGRKVEKHIKGGQLEWSPARVKLYLAKSQKPGKLVEGNKLRKELEGQKVLNGKVLDYLLAHPELIPDEWKGNRVCFWGTVYRDIVGRRYIDCLCWGGRRGWYREDRWLGRVWRNDCPAAVSVSI